MPGIEMTQQFIIVNNGMTEMRGHYLETALSVAEAARRAGYRPSMAVHVDCPVAEMPDWLECLPIFHVNHWGEKAPIDVPPSGNRLKAIARRLLPHSVRNSIRRLKQTRHPASPVSIVEFDEAKINRILAEIKSDPATNHDLYCCRLFEENMAQLLRQLGAGPRDHVFLPTAHFREAWAIRRLIHAQGANRAPRFHLEFRHEVVPAGESDPRIVEHVAHTSQLGRWYFEAIRVYPPTDRMQCFTDTQELGEDYRHLCGVPFGVLPIPFAHDLIQNSPTPGTPPYTCVYLGDIREEKGFAVLPKLVRKVLADHAESLRLRFAFQGTQIHRASRTWALIAAMAELGTYPPEQVDLVGRDKPFLERSEYFDLLGRADIVLCVHDAFNYRARSSGILTEAIAAGKPVIVPANTWMAHQLPAGCGEVFTDDESLANALRAICDKYEAYHRRLQECRAHWLAKHSPTALLNILVANDRFGESAQSAA